MNLFKEKETLFFHHHLFFSVPCLLHTFLFSFSLTACQWGIFSVFLVFLLNWTLPCKASLVVCHFISGESVCFLMGEWKKRQIRLQTIKKSPTHSTRNVGHLSFCSLFKTWDDYHTFNPHGLGGFWAPGQISCHCYSQRIQVQNCAHCVITICYQISIKSICGLNYNIIFITNLLWHYGSYFETLGSHTEN